MALSVLLIPEDFTRDQHVLKPIVRAMLEHIGRSARVVVCQEPRLGGIGEALKWDRIAAILDDNPMVECFLLLVDRDGDEKRRARLDGIEEKATRHLGPRRFLLAEHAWQEVEAWLLAGMDDLPSDWSWEELRNEPNVKEQYFLPYVAQRGLVRAPAEGRQKLGREAASRYKRIRSLCAEDIGALEARLTERLR